MGIELKYKIHDLVINSFPQIDETKKEEDLVNEEKINHLEHLRSVLYVALKLISVMSLTCMFLTAVIHVTRKDIAYIVFGAIFTAYVVMAAVSHRIFEGKLKKISYTYSKAQYEFIDRIKQFWENINKILKEETTSISFIREEGATFLKVLYLDEDGKLHSEKFCLSDNHILFKDVSNFIVDFDLSGDPFVYSCTNFIIPKRYYKDFHAYEDTIDVVLLLD